MLLRRDGWRGRLGGLALALITKGAFAEEPLPVRQDEQATASVPGERWYGSETLAVDGICFGLVLVGGAAGAKDAAGPILIVGGLGYFFGPAVVHAHHERAGAMLLSPVMRAALPVAGAVLGHLVELSSEPSCDHHCGPPELGATPWTVGGLILGYLGAVTFDAAVLAYETVEPSDHGHRSSPSPLDLVSVRPNLELLSGGLRFGVAGAF